MTYDWYADPLGLASFLGTDSEWTHPDVDADPPTAWAVVDDIVDRLPPELHPGGPTFGRCGQHVAFGDGATYRVEPDGSVVRLVELCDPDRAAAGWYRRTGWELTRWRDRVEVERHVVLLGPDQLEDEEPLDDEDEP